VARWFIHSNNVLAHVHEPQIVLVNSRTLNRYKLEAWGDFARRVAMHVKDGDRIQVRSAVAGHLVPFFFI
jgi:hypothetical protein